MAVEQVIRRELEQVERHLNLDWMPHASQQLRMELEYKRDALLGELLELQLKRHEK